MLNTPVSMMYVYDNVYDNVCDNVCDNVYDNVYDIRMYFLNRMQDKIISCR